jgi:O-antigen/teichoic acid export membrane protein
MTSGAVTGIALAIVGFGPWAIVAQSLTIATVSSVLLWRSSSWRPSATFSWDSLRAMSGFTGHVFGTRLLSWANLNVDNFLVGRFLGAAELGAYSIAFSIAITPVTRFALPISDVFFPAFSRLRDPRRVGEIWLRAARMVALVVVPAMLGLVAVAPELVNVVFGSKWHAAAPVLRLFAPIGLIQALTVLNNGVLQSLDRARLLFRISAVISVGSVVAYASGLPWGIKGVALALLIVSFALQPLFLWLTLRVVGLSLREWLGSVGGVLQAGIAMLLALLGLSRLLHGLEPAVRLPILILAGALIYGALVLWRAPEVIPELRRVVRGRTGAAGAVATEPDHSPA